MNTLARLSSCSALHLFLSVSASAQCLRWTESFAPPNGVDGLTSNVVGAATGWDDGAGGGEALYVAGLFETAGGVPARGLARWSHASGWSEPGDLQSNCATLLVAQLAGDARPMLYAGGAFHTAGGVLARGVARFDGTNWTALGSGLVNGGPFMGFIDQCVFTLAAFDDGTGTKLYAGGDFPGADVAVFDGTSWSSVGILHGRVFSLVVHDDGSGPRLHAAGSLAGFAYVAAFDGVQWNTLAGAGSGPGPSSTVYTLASLDDGSGPALFAGRLDIGQPSFFGGYVWRWRFGAWSEVSGGPQSTVNVLRVFDLGSGPALYAGGPFASAGGVAGTRNLARWDGTSWSGVQGGIDAGPIPTNVVTLCTAYDAHAGETAFVCAGEFASAGGVPAQNVARLVRCRTASFCAGDGSLSDHTTPCPCGNDGAPGRGCAHSFDAGGAELSLAGDPADDDIVLRAAHLPATSFTLMLQHDAAGDTVFHDGVLCASGSLVRLRGRAAMSGEASFPNSNFAQDATTTLSQRGGVALGSGVRRYYSAWFRNASSTFCPPATANVTNGWLVDW